MEKNLNADYSQKTCFVEYEGDHYFTRNSRKLTAAQTSPEFEFYRGHLPKGAKILEIGSANGRALAQLCRDGTAEGWGIDPSEAAIVDGRTRYPQLHLEVGTADHLPFDDASFDVLLFGFCLYLVDRPLLPRVVAEADRVLKDGGILMITDFDPLFPHKRPYHHCPGLWSYKMDYPRLFTAYPHYVDIAKFPFSMRGPGWHPDPQERVAAWVLAKQTASAYAEVSPQLPGNPS